MKSTRLLLSISALATGLILSGETRAEDWKIVGQAGYLGVGKAYEIEKGHVYWVGEYAGIFFNDKGEKSLFDHAGVKCPAWGDIDFNSKKLKEGGVCVLTDLDGEGLFDIPRYGDSVALQRNVGVDGRDGQIRRSKEVTPMLVTSR